MFNQTDMSSILEISKWKGEGVIAGITTRKGGFSQSPYDTLNMGFHVHDDSELVTKNYNRIEEELEIPLDWWVSSKQVHGTDVYEVGEPIHPEHSLRPPNFTLEYDGWITNQNRVLLTGVFADCVPLYFRSKEWVGLAHAGWKGTVHEMGPKMIDRFIAHHVPLEEIEVVIGPCIGPLHYEVDDTVVKHISKAFQTEDVMTRTDENHYLLNLKQLHKNLLIQKGLKEDQINVTNYCTYENEDLFYSHRRDQGKTGRMMAFIGFH